MKAVILSSAFGLWALGQSFAASAVNLDGEPFTLTVTENGAQSEITVGAGETLDFCSDGCFVTLPNGDRAALTGGETLEISGGAARVK
ncbi:MAG: hypothetical protein DI629_20630 [Mesorhizobium amorphae]|nr:MAG: hypothetical protein DI629_20630 [Mesorhizobium amorphae]